MLVVGGFKAYKKGSHIFEFSTHFQVKDIPFPFSEDEGHPYKDVSVVIYCPLVARTYTSFSAWKMSGDSMGGRRCVCQVVDEG